MAVAARELTEELRPQAQRANAILDGTTDDVRCAREIICVISALIQITKKYPTIKEDRLVRARERQYDRIHETYDDDCWRRALVVMDAYFVELWGAAWQDEMRASLDEE